MPFEIDWKNLEAQILDVQSELVRASKKFDKFNSAHEGYAVILEELEELWEEIKKNSEKRNLWKMREEAKQICAMVLRFIHDVCPLLEPY